MKTYSELITIPDFSGRFEYLKLDGRVGEETFGFERYLNQKFYTSREWKQVRYKVIARDNGCDLGIEDRVVYGRIVIHHMNPMNVDDILRHPEMLLNPEFLITVSGLTHKALHYSNEELLPKDYIPRTPNDTIPWRTP